MATSDRIDKSEKSYEKIESEGRKRSKKRDHSLAVFISIYFLVVLFTSYTGVCGDWQDTSFGVLFYNHWDPMGSYIAGGIDLFGSGKYTPFFGHPGLPLMFLIHFIAKTGYFLFMLLGGTADFEMFAAKNVRWIIFYSKAATICITLLSFILLYFVSRKLTENKNIALLTVVAYATTLPVLYYADRISPESFLVLFTLLTFFSIWKFQESIDKRKELKAYQFIILAAFASVGAVYSKLHLSYPLIPFAFAYILTVREKTAIEHGPSLRMRFLPPVIFICFAAFFLYLGSLKTDWRAFFNLWKDWGPLKHDFVHSGYTWDSIREKISFLLSSLLSLTSQSEKDTALPLGVVYRKYLFFVVEWIFIVFSASGLVMFWKNQPEKRRVLVYIIVYLFLLLPTIIYHPSIHYLFIHLSFAAIFCAYFVFLVVEKLTHREVGLRRKFWLSFGLIILFQQLSLAFAVDIRLNDYRQYKRWRGYYDALDIIDYGEKIGLVKQFPQDFYTLHGAGWLPDSTRYLNALRNFVHVVKPGESLSLNQLKELEIRVIVALTKDNYKMQFLDETTARSKP